MQLILALAWAQAFSPAGGQLAPDHLVRLVEPNGLGQVCPLVVVLRLRIDRVGNLGDLPGQIGLDHRVLNDPVAAALETTLLERGPQSRQVAALLARFGRRGVGRRAGRHERGAACRRAVAVDALDLDRRAHLAIQLGVAVGVLDEMAIDAVHPLLEVDVHLVDGQAVALRFRAVERCALRGRRIPRAIALLQLGGQAHRFHHGGGGGIRNRLSPVVEQVAVPVFLEDRAEDPAVTVEVGKLGMPRLRVQLGDPFQERRVRPVAPRRGLVRVRHHRAGKFLGGRVFLVLGIHELAVGFFVPPHVTSVRVEHVRAGMNVADDALAGGHSRDELMLDRMPRLVARDGRVRLEAIALVAEDGVRPGVDRRPVVGINHVTGRAAARAIVAWVIVGPQEVECRIEQTGLLQPDENGVGAIPRAESARRSNRPRACRAPPRGWECRSPEARACPARRSAGYYPAARPRSAAGGRGTAPRLSGRSPRESAAARSASVAAHRACCSSRRSAPI